MLGHEFLPFLLGEMYPLAKTNGELWKAMRKNKRKRSGFTKPWWLTFSILVIALGAVASVVCAVCGQPEVASAIGSTALIVTLLVVVLYTHYTGIYTKASAFPSVSFELRSPEPGFFQFWIKNHSNVPVSCWCKLNPTYENTKLRFGGREDQGGFYDGGSSFDVLPYQTVHGGSFDLHVFFMGENNHAWNDIVDRCNDGGLPKMRFQIEFWYEARDLGFRSSTIEHRYYYDFGIGKMVLDY